MQYQQYFVFLTHRKKERLHSWRGNKHFKKCEHGKLKKRKWLKANSSSFKALRSVVEDKKVLEDLQYLTEFRNTGNLEVYHSVINKYCPKRLHFLWNDRKNTVGNT